MSAPHLRSRRRRPRRAAPAAPARCAAHSRSGVVEERVHLTALLGEPLDRLDPLLELRAGVEPVESLARRARLLVPRLPVAPVEPQERDGVRRRRNPRHDVRRARRRRIDRDVRKPFVLEEGQRPGALLLRHPRTMPELDQRDERRQQLAHAAQLVHRRTRLDEARVVLQQDTAQLPRLLERRERRAELAERDLARLRSPRVPVICADAFACHTKPGGVRSAHRAAFSGEGRR